MAAAVQRRLPARSVTAAACTPDCLKVQLTWTFWEERDGSNRRSRGASTRSRKVSCRRAARTVDILLAILEAVEQRIEPTGRGARAFPFNRVEVSIVAPSLEARGRLEAVLGGDTPLQTRVLDRLRSAGCSPVDVVIEVRYVDTAEASWNVPEFDLQFARIARPETDRRDLDARAGAD